MQGQIAGDLAAKCFANFYGGETFGIVGTQAVGKACIFDPKGEALREVGLLEDFLFLEMKVVPFDDIFPQHPLMNNFNLYLIASISLKYYCTLQ